MLLKHRRPLGFGKYTKGLTFNYFAKKLKYITLYISSTLLSSFTSYLVFRKHQRWLTQCYCEQLVFLTESILGGFEQTIML